MARIRDKLTDPAFQAACQRIIAHPAAHPEAKELARPALALTASGRAKLAGD